MIWYQVEAHAALLWTDCCNLWSFTFANLDGDKDDDYDHDDYSDDDDDYSDDYGEDDNDDLNDNILRSDKADTERRFSWDVLGHMDQTLLGSSYLDLVLLLMITFFVCLLV